MQGRRTGRVKKFYRTLEKAVHNYDAALIHCFRNEKEEVTTMFGIGVPELILILVIGLVVFGPGKLPAVGNALGRSLREFKSAVNDDGDRSEAAAKKTQE